MPPATIAPLRNFKPIVHLNLRVARVGNWIAVIATVAPPVTLANVRNMTVALSVGVEVVGDGVGELGGTPSPVRDVASLAQRLEAAGVGYWIIGAERGERSDATHVTLDPSLLATVAARHTSALGLVVAAAAHRDHPYNLARRLLSVDHAARGRVGWLALDFDHGTALNAATDTWLGDELGPAHTADAVAAVRTLWRTWPLKSVVGDRATGVFADTAQIRRADVALGYRIAGPLNVPGSVQGDLPVWRQAISGIDASVSGADIVVVEEGSPVPAGRPAVVRVRSIQRIGSVLERLSANGNAAGIVVRLAPHALIPFLDGALPEARRRGFVASGTRSASLRQRLHLPVPQQPDLAGHALAFDSAPNPGGRL